MEETALRNLENKFKILAGIALSIFAILLIRLWVLQIMQGASIMVKSRQNQTRVIRINAPRGIFYDREGKIIATSRISHTVSVVPEDIKDKPQVLQTLSKILKIPVSEIEAKLAPDPKRPRNPYQYLPISKDLDSVTIIKLLESKLDLPGVEVDDIPLRYYPYGEYASHLFGYIREISEGELNDLKSKGYRTGDLIGKTGLERTYEEYLRGVDGGKIYEVDIHGRPLRLLENREPQPGNNLHLTIDRKVQMVAEKALDEQLTYLQKHSRWRNAKAGAVVALDPRNGNILAMASKPGFDPNLFVGVITPEIAQNLYNNPLHPFLNRVIQGEFAPGSTFKPITVLAALMEHKVDEKQKFYCNGLDPVWGKDFKCWIYSERGGGHGAQTIIEGLKNSCNIVMAELSRRIGPDTLAKYSRFLGLGRATGINLYPGERLGLVPDTEWKRRQTKDKVWVPLETLHFGIGQGALTVTPLQLAQVYAAIANDGKVYRPRIVSKITSPGGEVVWDNQPKLATHLNVPPKILATVQEGLTEVVNEGTAAWVFRDFPLDKYPVAGKTGTVQKPPYDNSGVFASYAPVGNPEIVVIVFVEQGGGSSSAVPIARKVLEAYFDLDEQPKPTSAPGTVVPQSPAVTPAPAEGEGLLLPPVNPANTNPSSKPSVSPTDNGAAAPSPSPRP